MKHINGKQWQEALISASNSMSNNIDRIDAMNVFPVPDGDTGSNMGATIEYAANEVKKIDSENVGEIAQKFSRGMLLGARGNSGVILSQIFKGFAVALEGKSSVSQFDLVHAFQSAKEYAYKSVMKPVEGTILTVIRLVQEDLNKTITASHSVAEVFAKAVEFARKACDKTPEFLPVLKEVGVTDSGGEGLYVILEGMSEYFQGRPVEMQKQATGGSSFIMEEESFDGEFGYCTEFIVELKVPAAFKKDKFEAALARMGNSIVVVNDEEILKVHIHTLRPGNVFNFAQKFGEFIKIKSDNMTLQANESQKAKKSAAGEINTEKVNIGVVSCNVGGGIIDDMKELGTDFIIEAGQSANPSAQDFIQAINALNTDKIILLPNNGNIILVAQQVAQTSDKEVIVVPTRTQMEGLTAMMNFDRDAKLHENKEMMEEAIAAVQTGQVTKAARTTKIEGVAVREGEYLSIAGKKILGSVNSKTEAAKKICDEIITDETELVTIYYGDDSTETDAEDVASYIETHFDAAVEIKNGKQPTYNFLIAFE